MCRRSSPGCETSACRVFDDDEGHRVAQISVPEKRMQFFLFPARAKSKGHAADGIFTVGAIVEQEGWTGAVQVKNGVCFMAALRGERRIWRPIWRSKSRRARGCFSVVDTIAGAASNFLAARQGSSVVEQGTHKPLVGSSTLPSGTFFLCHGPAIYFDDLRVGDRFQSEPYQVTERRSWTSRASSMCSRFISITLRRRRAIFQGLSASGWHTAAIAMRLFTTGPLQFVGGAVGLGVDELRWPIAVRPGDSFNSRPKFWRCGRRNQIRNAASFESAMS